MRWGMIALALAAVPLGCAPSPPQWQDPAALDREPPYLLAVSPDGNAVPPADCLILRFSEPLFAASLAPAGDAALAGALVLEGRAASDAVVQVSRGSLPAEGAGQPVAAAVTLDEDDTAVLLCPLAPLADESEYTLVATRRLTDRAHNPLCFGPDDPTTYSAAVTITTTFAGPRVLSVFPANDAAAVPPTLEAVVIEFSRPVRPASVDAESVRLVEQGGEDLGFERYELLEDNTRVRALLHPGQWLALATEHFVRLSTAIRDADADRALVTPFHSRFVTAAELDETPPQFVEAPAVEADDVEAILRLTTDEPARLVLSYGPVDGIARELNLEDLVSQRSVRLAPLEPEQEYAAQLELTDAGGNRAPIVTVGFTTSAARGRPVITEVMANPAGAADEEHSREYVEILNAGAAKVDLAGFYLDEKGDRSGADPLSLAKGVAGPLELEPGQYAVVVTTAYADEYILPGATLLLTVDDSRLGSDGLARSESVELYAQDPVGGAAPVSTYGGWFSATREGASVERLDPLGADGAANWRLREAGGTPGAPPDN